MQKKFKIQVRDQAGLKAINRVLTSEAIGNFNPIFCTYKGKKHLVKSEEGDLSDPFRREESYASTFFINV